MLEYILKSLYEYINENIPEILYIDLYKGTVQDINNGSIEGAVRPALLIEFSDIKAESTIGNTIRHNGFITFHLITDAYGGFANKSDALTANLAQLKLIEDVYQKLAFYDDKETLLNQEYPYSFSAFIRRNTKYLDTIGNLMESNITFEFVLIDNSILNTLTEYTINSFDLGLELNKNLNV